MKRIIFWAILVSPALVVAFFFAAFVVDVVRINRVSHERISGDFDKFLAARKGSAFPPPAAFHMMDPANANIFLFGASSVVISDGKTFADYMETGLGGSGGRVKVVNFGIPGIDSHSVRLRVEQSLRFGAYPPRAIVLYYGHNDYNVAYSSSLNTHWDNAFNAFLKISYYLSGREFKFPDQKYVFKAEAYSDYLWYARFTRPVFFDIVQKLRLYRVDNESYEGYNAKILEQFKRNNDAILAMAKERGIPVVLVTPIGNLHARPYGSIDVSERNYRLGIGSKDYAESVGYLIKAKDGEIFTGDTRAKSPVLDYLRSLDDGKTVFVFDLERDFIGREFSFDTTNFLDYFHLNDRAHRAVGEYMTEKIRSAPPLNKALSVD